MRNAGPKTLETLQTLVLVDQYSMRVAVWQRTGPGRDIIHDWDSTTLTTREVAVDLPVLGLILPLAEIYAGLSI